MMPMLRDVNSTGYKSVISTNKNVMPQGGILSDLDSRNGDNEFL